MEDIDRALATMKTSSCMGGDWWDVAALRIAPVGAKQQLAEMFTRWRRQGLLPIQLMYNIVKLIPKPGGGERPIALMPMLVRLYFRLGKGEEQEWLQEKVKHYDKAVKGSSALQAALGVLFRDELAAGKGEARVSVLWDLEKFFDNIALDVLIRRAMQFGYPGRLLLASVRCYLGPRMLVWQDVTGDWRMPNSSICAGCVRACNMARLVVYGVLEKVTEYNPRVQICQYVEDINTTVQDRNRDVAVCGLGRVVEDMKEGCERDFLVVSSKKTCIVSRDRGLVDLVRRRLKRTYGDMLVGRGGEGPETSYFGAKVLVSPLPPPWGVAVMLPSVLTLGRPRRITRVSAKRFKEASRRSGKISRFGAKVKEKYLRTAAWAKASYHVPFKGASPTEMDRLRSLARASTGMDGAGGCKTSIIGLRLGISWDPEVRAVQLQIKEWLKWWWTNPEHRIDAARLWIATRSRLKEMGRTRRWKNVNGLVAAMVAMLLNLGWEPEGPVI